MTTDNVDIGHTTGLADKNYNLLKVTVAFYKSAWHFENFKRSAESDGDRELADFLGRVQADSRRAAAEAAELLRARFLAG